MRFLVPLAILAGCSGPTDDPYVPPVPENLVVEAADGVSQMEFSPQGVRLEKDSDAPWFIGFEHSGFGRAGAMKAMDEVAPTSDGDRIVYAHDGIRSWYVNNVDGLEQGFDLDVRPPGEGPLRVDVLLDTDLIPVVRHDRKAINLLAEDGLVAVEYDSLFAFDSTGAEVDAWMELDCTDRCVISLLVDDADAIYPLTIDPRVYANVQVIDKPFSGNPSSEQFGYSLSVSGDTAVVGDPGYKQNPGSNFGAVHVYTRNAGTGLWSKQADLLCGTATNDRCGTSVAIDGTTIVVGSPGNERAFVYTGAGASWTQQAVLTPPTSQTGFGTSVTIRGDLAAVGAPAASSSTGAVFTYTRTGTTWSAGTALPAPGTVPVAGDAFGTSVFIDGTTLAVGAPGTDTAASNGGAVAIYTRPASSWVFQTMLFAGDPLANAALGTSVALRSDTLVAGAPRTGTNTGDAYVFVGAGASWAQQAKLTPSGTVSPASSRFGSSVAIRLNQIVVGAPQHGPSNRGAAYTFYRSGTTWTQGSVLQTGTPSGQNEGLTVGVTTTDVLTGAPNGSSKGKVYIYRVQTDADGDGWTACGGLVTSPCDCDDTNAAVNPDATEVEGNTVDENCDNLLAICGTAPKTGCNTDLAITEVMALPTGGTNQKWFELKNRSAHRVDLRGMQLYASGAFVNNSALQVSNAVVDPGGYIVLAASTDSGLNGGITGASQFTPGFSLYDDITELRISRASTLAQLDSVTFTDEHSSGTARPVGASFSVDFDYETAADNDNAFRWCDGASAYGGGQFGTPGAANDDCDFSFCFTATYTQPAGPDLVIGSPTPIQIDFLFDPDGATGNVGIGVPPFDLARWFVTSNLGEGTFTRTTASGTGQTLEFTYLYVDEFGAPDGIGAIYEGVQAFGTSSVTGGTIIPPAASPYTAGTWTAVACP